MMVLALGMSRPFSMMVVVVSPHEGQHPVFQFLGFHLAVGHADFHVRYEPVQDILDGRQFLHLVVQEEYLSSAIELVVDDALDFVFVEKDDFRLDGDAVGRGSLDNGQIPGTQQRELKGTGNRRGSKSKGIHGVLDLAQFFLGRYAEFLLFVNDQKPQVLEIKASSQDFMRADENVYLPFFVRNLLGRAEAAHIFHRAGQVGQTGFESLVMLQGKDGGGHQHSHLLGIRNSLEGGPDGYFRLAETYVSTNQAVHGAGILHILLHRLGGPLLIRGILIHEGRFQLFLKVSIGRKGKTSGSAALGIQLDQFLGYVLYPGFGGTLEVAPGFGAQFVHSRRFSFLGAEAGNLVQGMDGYKNYVSSAVDKFYHFLHAAVIVLYLHQTAENTHAMVYMNYIVSQIEGVKVIEGELLGFVHRPSQAHTVETVEDFVVRVPAHFVFVVYEAGMDVLSLDEFRHGRMLVLQHDGMETLQLAFLFPEDIDLVIALYAGADIGNEEFEVFVENRLRSNVETNGFHLLPLERNIQINSFVGR